MNNDLISREALKEDFKSRLAACNEWIEKAKDEETKIRASAVKAFIAEVVMTINNAPTVPLPDFKEGYKQAIIDGKTNFSRPQGKWIGDTDYESFQGYYEAYKCNKCSYGLHWRDYYTNDYKFCPNCGADMRKGG